MGAFNEQGEPARSAINPTGSSFGSLRTDLDRVYLELGGPAPLRGRVDRNTFARCCNEFAWGKVEPTLRRFQKDRNIAKRHWPWVAFSLSQYRFEQKERQQNGVRLDPKEVISLLNDIRRSAKELVSGLVRFQTYSQALGDPTAPFEKPHLRYLDQILSLIHISEPTRRS